MIMHAIQTIHVIDTAIIITTLKVTKINLPSH